MKKFIFSILFTTSLVAAPQAIVFDFGGVMTGEPNREAVINFLCSSMHLSEAEFEKANLEKKKALEMGKTDAEFWDSFAKEKGIALSPHWTEELNAVLKEAIGVNPEMYALVEKLKEKNIPVALLSNIDPRLSKLLREFGLYAPFDPCVLSCEIGVNKPDPKAYQAVQDKLKVEAKDIVFIDDKQENVQAAQEFGLDAILFTSVDQLRTELKKRDLL